MRQVVRHITFFFASLLFVWLGAFSTVFIRRHARLHALQALHGWLALTQGGVQASLVVFTTTIQQSALISDNGFVSFMTKQKS